MRADIPSLRDRPLLRPERRARCGQRRRRTRSTSVRTNWPRVVAYADEHPVDPNDCITICWTSGTESRPKGVPRAHYEWLVMSWDTVYSPSLTPRGPHSEPVPDGEHGRHQRHVPAVAAGRLRARAAPPLRPRRSSCARSRTRRHHLHGRPAGAAGDAAAARGTARRQRHLDPAPDRFGIGAAAGVDGARLVRQVRHLDHQLLRLERGHLADDRREADDRPGPAGPLLPALRRRAGTGASRPRSARPSS